MRIFFFCSSKLSQISYMHFIRDSIFVMEHLIINTNTLFKRTKWPYSSFWPQLTLEHHIHKYVTYSGSEKMNLTDCFFRNLTWKYRDNEGKKKKVVEIETKRISRGGFIAIRLYYSQSYEESETRKKWEVWSWDGAGVVW